MTFLVVFACTAAAVFALKPAIAKAPAAWYALAAVLVALFLAGTQGRLPAVVGGAVFLGARGVVVKTHGASTAESYRKSVLNAEELAKRNIPKAMEEGMAKYEYSND